MFSSKFMFKVLIILVFLTLTSIVKNQSRLLEKKISNLYSIVLAKEKNLSETQLDFYYLTSPAEIEKNFKSNKKSEFRPIAQSKIFMNIKDYTSLEKKLSNLKTINEKKIQKK